MLLRLEGDDATGWRPAQPTVFMTGADDPMFSPDGRWMAYVVEGARARAKSEVYVQPFPGSGGRWQISTDGGDNPAWSSTRQELIYATPDQRIMAVSYSVYRRLVSCRKAAGAAELAFFATGGRSKLRPASRRRQDCAGQGARNGSPKRNDHVMLIFNFLDELRRIAPPGK